MEAIKTKLAIFSTRNYDKTYFTKMNEELGIHYEMTFFECQLNAKTGIMAKDHHAVCVFVNDDLSKEVLDILHEQDIKTIVLRCAGFNNIDLEYAKEKRFKIARVPAYSPNAIAEHAVCLMLALNRRIKKSIDRVREGNFSLDGLLGFDMVNKTVGVIGTGRIGAILAKIVHGFGCKVLLFDPYKNQELVNLGMKYVEMDEVLTSSDIISLHCNLTAENTHLINEEVIKTMRDGVMIINTSRGALLDTKAIIRGLKSGKIGYLGIDVVEHEEDIFFKDLSDSTVKDDDILRLMSFNNVIITAHQAFFTKEALTCIAQTTLSNLRDIVEGSECKNLIF